MLRLRRSAHDGLLDDASRCQAVAAYVVRSTSRSATKTASRGRQRPSPTHHAARSRSGASLRAAGSSLQVTRGRRSRASERPDENSTWSARRDTHPPAPGRPRRCGLSDAVEHEARTADDDARQRLGACAVRARRARDCRSLPCAGAAPRYLTVERTYSGRVPSRAQTRRPAPRTSIDRLTTSIPSRAGSSSNSSGESKRVECRGDARSASADARVVALGDAPHAAPGVAALRTADHRPVASVRSAAASRAVADSDRARRCVLTRSG